MNTLRRPSAHLSILLAAALGLALGCAERPGSVAESFWEAVAASDVERAMSLSEGGSARRIERLAERRALTDIEVGEPVVEGDTAEVETRLLRGGSPLSFTTRLVRIDGDWKVDESDSSQAFRAAIVEASMAGLNDVLSEGAEVVGEAVEEGLDQAAEAMREALEQIEGYRGER